MEKKEMNHLRWKLVFRFLWVVSIVCGVLGGWVVSAFKDQAPWLIVVPMALGTMLVLVYYRHRARAVRTGAGTTQLMAHFYPPTVSDESVRHGRLHSSGERRHAAA